VLAYVFWHQPRDGSEVAGYEDAQIGFHHSLAHSRPVGFLGSACYRSGELPWLGGDPGYEDWYFVDDFAALGVLNEAAVGLGHRTAHERVARHFGAGAGGLYGLIEGRAIDSLASVVQTTVAIWVARPAGSQRLALGEMLGDGMDPAHASLWRRQLVLGPAPEFCLLAAEAPSGVGPARLPSDWTARSFERETLWYG
jgi:hypothetical protein